MNTYYYTKAEVTWKESKCFGFSAELNSVAGVIHHSRTRNECRAGNINPNLENFHARRRKSFKQLSRERRVR